MNDRYGPDWGENPFSLAVAPHDATLCYGTDFGRTIKTANGGKTWEAAYSKKLPDGSWTTIGIEVTTCYNIDFDPFDENHLFIALTDIGLMESKNGGQGWLSATHNNGVPQKWKNDTYWVQFDPDVKGRIWAVMSGIHDLPLPKMFRDGISHYTGGVVRSDDAGKTWQPVSESIGEGAMTHILMDPTSNKDARTLYVSVFGKGVYKSTDGGMSWEQKNNGIEGDEPFAWRIQRHSVPLRKTQINYVRMKVFLICCFFDVTTLHAQQLETGRITDVADGTPIPDATIIIANRSNETTIYGRSHFFELSPQDERQKNRWAKKRQSVYAVSLTRFLRALYHEQFRIINANRPLRIA